MIVERVEHPTWTSNSYLASDGTHGVIVDSNGVEDPLERIVAERGIELTHVLITHGDGDHVVNPERWGVSVITSYSEPIRSGSLEIRAFPTPGQRYTKVAQTPMVREKPYLFIDAQGGYAVRVPALRRDSAGIVRISSVFISPDGTFYAYAYSRVLSNLYLVEGLR